MFVEIEINDLLFSIIESFDKIDVLYLLNKCFLFAVRL